MKRKRDEPISRHKKLQLFRNLSKGREDVSAVRWEKGKKSGYMPTHQYDPHMYQLHKMKGGSFSLGTGMPPSIYSNP